MTTVAFVLLFLGALALVLLGFAVYWGGGAATVSIAGLFLLGLGIGHPEATQEYQQPYAKLVSYLDQLDDLKVPASARALAALVLVLAGLAIYGVGASAVFAFHAPIDLRGATWTSPADVQDLLAISAGTNLVTLRTDDLATRLEALPAVRSAEVRVVLPNTVRVDLVERCNRETTHGGSFPGLSGRCCSNHARAGVVDSSGDDFDDPVRTLGRDDGFGFPVGDPPRAAQ